MGLAFSDSAAAALGPSGLGILCKLGASGFRIATVIKTVAVSGFLFFLLPCPYFALGGAPPEKLKDDNPLLGVKCRQHKAS